MGSSQKIARERRVRFAQGIHAGLTQREAARNAGYKGSDKNLDTMTPRLMRHADVQAHLARLREKEDNRAVASREELLALHTEAVRLDLGPYMLFDDLGRYIGLNMKQMMLDGKTRLINCIEGVETQGAAKITEESVEHLPALKVKVKLDEKQGASDRIAKMMGYNAPKKMDHTIREDLAALTDDELKKRVAKRLKTIGVKNPEKYIRDRDGRGKHIFGVDGP